MEKNQAVSADVKKPITGMDLILGNNTNMDALSLEDRASLFVRYSEAQAAQTIDEEYIGKEIIVDEMTVYTRDYIDQETGFPGLATYVYFGIRGSTPFHTASSQALPFAGSIARFIGYDLNSGALPHPIKMEIGLTKAETGFKYNFKFKGLAEPLK